MNCNDDVMFTCPCSGGQFGFAFEYILKNFGITSMAGVTYIRNVMMFMRQRIRGFRGVALCKLMIDIDSVTAFLHCCWTASRSVVLVLHCEDLLFLEE